MWLLQQYGNVIIKEIAVLYNKNYTIILFSDQALEHILIKGISAG